MSAFGPRELERVLIDALSPVPGSTMIDQPDWVQMITPGRRWPNLNCIMLARLSEADADRRITEVLQRYRELDVPFRWVVGPSSTPDDLSARLVRAGVPVHAPSLGMFMQVPAEIPPWPADLTLKVVGPDDVPRYADVNAQGWERDEDFRRESEAAIRRALDRPDQRMRAWLIERDGELVGSFNLCLLPGAGYFQGAAIVPEQRRKGIYRATIHHRLAVLRELGVEHAVVWARESSSAGVCQRAGFVEGCRATMHEWSPPP